VPGCRISAGVSLLIIHHEKNFAKKLKVI